MSFLSKAPLSLALLFILFSTIDLKAETFQSIDDCILGVKKYFPGIVNGGKALELTGDQNGLACKLSLRLSGENKLILNLLEEYNYNGEVNYLSVINALLMNSSEYNDYDLKRCVVDSENFDIKFIHKELASWKKRREFTLQLKDKFVRFREKEGVFLFPSLNSSVDKTCLLK